MVLFQRRGNAGVYLQSVVGGTDTQDVLRDGEPVPGCRARQPRVLALTRTCSILSCHHLTIDVGLHLVQLLVTNPRRSNLGVVLPGIVASPGHGLTDDDPRIVVTEDAGILLVSGRVGRYFAHLDMVAGEGGMVEHHAMLAVEIALAAVECPVHHAIFQSDAGHRAETLALDEDFAFLILIGANLVAIEVVGPQIPLAVPAVLLHSLNHCVDTLPGTVGLVLFSGFLAQLYVLLACKDEETGYHEAFGL